MTQADASPGYAKRGDHLVRSPRTTDAVGHALRSAFAPQALPLDLATLVGRLDTVFRH